MPSPPASWSTRMRTLPGSSTSCAAERTTERICPMAAAASTSCPTTSPTTIPATALPPTVGRGGQHVVPVAPHLRVVGVGRVEGPDVEPVDADEPRRVRQQLRCNVSAKSCSRACSRAFSSSRAVRAAAPPTTARSCGASPVGCGHTTSSPRTSCCPSTGRRARVPPAAAPGRRSSCTSRAATARPNRAPPGRRRGRSARACRRRAAGRARRPGRGTGDGRGARAAACRARRPPRGRCARTARAPGRRAHRDELVAEDAGHLLQDPVRVGGAVGAPGSRGPSTASPTTASRRVRTSRRAPAVRSTAVRR